MNDPTNTFDKYLAYDSVNGTSFPLKMISPVNVICTVSYVRFLLMPISDVVPPYTDPAAYIQITSTNFVGTSTMTQNVNGSKSGMILPIMNPDNTLISVKGYFRAKYSGPCDLYFTILNSTFQPVSTSRVIVNIHMFEDKGQILNN
jgi:hypothetical protein